ncbi:MAG: 16S rRNA (guanine(966)-N(2))-methyltransferase RsmD [Clostridia bacterium]|nr:16S rRNA (guanine(966)-N(2))-methyltransferase RsmD [Clostridia bacterium]
MRIVSGSARGRKLFTPVGMDIRPTTDKVKEALFSIIQFELTGRRVLDLFAGTGQLGLEALSRGAAKATFTDASRQAIELVKKNVRAVGFEDRSVVLHTDAFQFLTRTDETFDLVFLDPPYERGLCEKAAALLPRVLDDRAIVVAETRPDENLPAAIGPLAIYRDYRYSAIRLTVYRKAGPEGETN